MNSLKTRFRGLLEADDGDLAPDLSNCLGWSLLARDYTRRSLTHDSDKIVALLGFMNLLGEIKGIKTAAGLLTEGLLWRLLWFLNTPGRRLQNESPTWSWTAVAGQVQYQLPYSVERDWKLQDCHAALLYIPEAELRVLPLSEMRGMEAQLAIKTHPVENKVLGSSRSTRITEFQYREYDLTLYSRPVMKQRSRYGDMASADLQLSLGNPCEWSDKKTMNVGE